MQGEVERLERRIAEELLDPERQQGSHWRFFSYYVAPIRHHVEFLRSEVKRWITFQLQLPESHQGSLDSHSYTAFAVQFHRDRET